MSETILFPNSGPRPSPTSRPLIVVHKHALSTSVLIVFAALLLFGAVWYGWHAWPPPNDGAALGRAFAPRLLESLAVGFEAEAAALEAGKSVAEADDALKAAFHDARVKAFAEHAAPAFNAIVPSGSEPKDEPTRRAFIQLHRNFARGLVGSK